MNADTPQVREDFETLARREGLEVATKKPDGRYWSSHTHLAWTFYLAATERAIAACVDVDEPSWTGYECPNTFGDGVSACTYAIRAKAAL